jgi:hypothetical protein
MLKVLLGIQMNSIFSTTDSLSILFVSHSSRSKAEGNDKQGSSFQCCTLAASVSRFCRDHEEVHLSDEEQEKREKKYSLLLLLSSSFSRGFTIKCCVHLFLLRQRRSHNKKEKREATRTSEKLFFSSLHHRVE